MNEYWLPCEGGYYSVSNHGRVRRERKALGTSVGRVLKPYKMRDGYLMVRLYGPQGDRRVLIHRLVAQVFIGSCPKGKQTNHKNGIKSDNRARNLEYMTGSENCTHAFRTGLRTPTIGESNGCAKLTEDLVRAIRESRSSGVTQQAIANKLGIARATVSLAERGKTWGHVR